jgi:hypothetical protein
VNPMTAEEIVQLIEFAASEVPEAVTIAKAIANAWCGSDQDAVKALAGVLPDADAQSVTVEQVIAAQRAKAQAASGAP